MAPAAGDGVAAAAGAVAVTTRVLDVFVANALDRAGADPPAAPDLLRPPASPART
ncbi:MULTISPECIES: hypothetical protein [unclassified Pseudonocardia]|uniref:hypothetical protein n=1 Tax=unclassified Pseudonocardia TaxID=2619320 RepID=UPI0001FFE3AB|nr:hypothetical protein [Pseudonocardia sp. Ae707_Ps1]